MNQIADTLYRFIKRKQHIVKWSAFIVLSAILLIVLINSNLNAMAGQGQTSRHPGVQTARQKNLAKPRIEATARQIAPGTGVTSATVTTQPTPQGGGAMVSGYLANPTPTSPPAPVNTTAGTTGGDVATIINQVFGAHADEAMNIAQCESGLNPGARNSISINGSYATGLFQILYPSTWSTTPEADQNPYDPTANTQAAYAIFVHDGYSWREWVCRT